MSISRLLSCAKLFCCPSKASDRFAHSQLRLFLSQSCRLSVKSACRASTS
jgi:hypothetical protein